MRVYIDFKENLEEKKIVRAWYEKRFIGEVYAVQKEPRVLFQTDCKI